jgi:RIO kinase 1
MDRYNIKEKEDNIFKVVETVFDEKTRLILVKMIEKGYFDEVEGAISTGKEANVYFAPAKPQAVAIKIFRIDILSFKKMRPYIEGDHRFKRFQNKRSGFIESWTKKEFKNLTRMQTHGIPSPKPIIVERNILVMEYLGTEEQVLPLLKDTEIEKPNNLYKRIMQSVKDLYRKAHLIHADLSEFNILYNSEEDDYFIIDVSQAVLWDHPRAEEFLIRDLFNLNQFFGSMGTKLIELEKLYKWVTGDEPSPIILSEVVGL